MSGISGLGKRIDLHSHSILSDGSLVPSEMLRRAETLGYFALAITDHVDASNLDHVVPKLVQAAKDLARHRKNTIIVPGVEITHAHPDNIPWLAREARALGAKLVLVHGETLIEPVMENTNHMAVTCEDVDILAHPGLLSEEDAKLAARNGVCLEISCRKGHSLTNGHVAKLALKFGSPLVVNTDTHGPADFLDQQSVYRVALGAGLTPEQARAALIENPRRLLERVGVKQEGPLT